MVGSEDTMVPLSWRRLGEDRARPGLLSLSWEGFQPKEGPLIRIVCACFFFKDMIDILVSGVQHKVSIFV